MDDHLQDNVNINSENNRYTNQETENIFNTFLNNNQKLTNSNDSSKNIYNNLVHNMSHKYKNNFKSLNTEHNKNSFIINKRKETIDSITNSYTKSYIPTVNKYNSKVVIENFRQSNDILNLLDNFISENNYQRNYEIQQEINKITVLFYEEDMAFNFTKVLNSHKNKNKLYHDMKVNLSLIPNDSYKHNFQTIKRRGISTDTIQRLFQGIGGKKREKRGPRRKLNVLIHSPYYSLNKKLKKPDEQSPKDNLRDYNRFPIRVLDGDYRPLNAYNFRSEEKTKWISPSNFVLNV